MNIGFGGPESALGALATLLFFVMVIATWIIIAASRFIQGGSVERLERVPQLYGYTVCLIAVIWGLVSVGAIVDGAFDLRAPHIAQGGWSGSLEPSVTSFEAYRATYRQSESFRSSDPLPPDTLPEATLRQRYEALRADRVERARHAAWRSLITGVVTLALASALFAVHWRWLRRRGLAMPAPAA